MKAIALFNNKGGVGKTTLLCNLAAELSLNKNKKILIVDADPQCNATQSIFSEDELIKIYENESSFTIYSLVKPLSQGKGYASQLTPRRSSNFGLDIIPGDPTLALMEDLLASDWKSAIAGDERGIRTTFLFNEMLKKCDQYDFVFFDMGPSLGSINRSILLACDYFLSPMSIDIFSLKAIENISTSISSWKRSIERGLETGTENKIEAELLNYKFRLKFLGYVTQQYTAKTKDGKKQAVNAYDKLMKKIPTVILKELVNKLQPNNTAHSYELGSIPNLHSLVPLSQSSHKPIAELKSKDGVVGAHFSKVEEARSIFKNISDKMLVNVENLR